MTQREKIHEMKVFVFSAEGFEFLKEAKSDIRKVKRRLTVLFDVQNS